MESNEDLVKQLSRFAKEKQVNFLIGSGVSAKSIGLMKDYDSNEKLIEHVKKVSEIVLDDAKSCDEKEKKIDLMDAELPVMKNFVLPGGHQAVPALTWPLPRDGYS